MTPKSDTHPLALSNRAAAFLAAPSTTQPKRDLLCSNATRSLSASTHPYSIFQLGVKPEVTWLYICKTDAEIRPESFALAHSALVKSFSIVENSPRKKFMADMSGQDPSEIIMATVDEERKGATFSGTVILGIAPEAGEVLFFRDFLIEDYKGELTAYLATDGDITKSIDLGELDHKSPSFGLPIPLGTDTSPYNTVVLSDKKSKKKILTINL